MNAVGDGWARIGSVAFATSLFVLIVVMVWVIILPLLIDLVECVWHRWSGR